MMHGQKNIKYNPMFLTLQQNLIPLLPFSCNTNTVDIHKRRSGAVAAACEIYRSSTEDWN